MSVAGAALRYSQATLREVFARIDSLLGLLGRAQGRERARRR
jgi:hypothetical protein